MFFGNARGYARRVSSARDARPCSPPKSEAPVVPFSHANTGAAPAARRRALVVDDNVDAAESIAVVLRLSGVDVETAHDGPAALAAARALHPAVIVLDIGLPGLDGYEVARQLRAEPAFRETFIVALTGYGQDEDRRRAAEAGFDLHLVKPVDPARLLALVFAAD